MSKILVVDDDPDFVEATRMVLESAGYEVISAADGDAGLITHSSDGLTIILTRSGNPGCDHENSLGWAAC